MFQKATLIALLAALAPLSARAQSVYSAFETSYVYRGELLAEEALAVGADFEGERLYGGLYMVRPIGARARSLYSTETGVYAGAGLFDIKGVAVSADVTAYGYFEGAAPGDESGAVEAALRAAFGDNPEITASAAVDVLSGDLFGAVTASAERALAPRVRIGLGAETGIVDYSDFPTYVYGQATAMIGYDLTGHLALELEGGGAVASAETLGAYDNIDGRSTRAFGLLKLVLSRERVESKPVQRAVEIPAPPDPTLSEFIVGN